MKHLNIIRAVGFCLVIIICVTIFLFSHSPADESKKHSGGITSFVVKVIYGERDDYTAEEYTEIYNRTHLIVRKMAHFSIYMALGFSALCFSCTFNIKDILMIGGALLFSALYAASDEFHQTFIAGRCGTPTDVLIDSCGAVVGIIISYIIIYRLAIRKCVNP